MMKAFKYRIYPTRKQRDALQFTLNRNRELYNAALEERREAWHMSRVSVSYKMQSAQLPEIKELRPEYKEIYPQVLQDTLKRVDKAFKAFFKRCKEGNTTGFPRFQGYDRYDSFTYPQIEKLKGKPTVAIENGKVLLPKIGHIKVKQHRPLEGKAKTCTIKREGEHWYVVFACEVEAQTKLPYTDLPIGIDMGLKHFMTDSNGDVVDNPRFFRKSHGRLKKKQQRLSKRRNKSHRRKKSAQLVGKGHKTVRNQRRDFHHKEARILVETFETIVFEDLSMHHMVKRPKVKQDENGTYLHNGASKKAGLNKSILDAGWASFIELVKHKAEWAGVTVMQVDPKKTSQICSACGKEGEHKDLSVRTHVCIYCAVVLDRDHNAAVNILDRGLGRSPRETVSPGTFPCATA
ncbi:MAG TPA: transposase [Ktedonobacteraceae bacterium]|nr:transposase [Ktedonobacteraceae bacterium]